MMVESESNPWLSIPAADYEGHMGSPEVAQLQFLSRVFDDMLKERRPKSIAVVGCATGNGFEHINPQHVSRVVGIDIQPDYLRVLSQRHAARLPMLELICGDVLTCRFDPRSFDFVFAGLIFEYVESEALLKRIHSWLAPSGMLGAVLQLPGEKRAVTETSYASLQRLEPLMKLIDAEDFHTLLQRAGFGVQHSRVEALASGKQFLVGTCRPA
jgi:SAM-dependent methyltransferase